MSYTVRRKRWMGDSSHAIEDVLLRDVSKVSARTELQQNAVNLLNHIFFNNSDAIIELTITTNGRDNLHVSVDTGATVSVYEFTVEGN